ncbi:MAG: hypothetical protein SWX82_13900 [Cyanobacteriota bacterium]|nr:hypothetical protein [Cyanobacteriota bacterium]
MYIVEATISPSSNWVYLGKSVISVISYQLSVISYQLSVPTTIACSLRKYAH